METSRWFQAKDLLNDAVFEAMSASNGKAGWGRMECLAWCQGHVEHDEMVKRGLLMMVNIGQMLVNNG
jgi:hypothetical protein